MSHCQVRQSMVLDSDLHKGPEAAVWGAEGIQTTELCKCLWHNMLMKSLLKNSSNLSEYWQAMMMTRIWISAFIYFLFQYNFKFIMILKSKNCFALWRQAVDMTSTTNIEFHAYVNRLLRANLFTWVVLARGSMSFIYISSCTNESNSYHMSNISIDASLSTFFFSLTGASTRRHPRGKTCCWDPGPLPFSSSLPPICPSSSYSLISGFPPSAPLPLSYIPEHHTGPPPRPVICYLFLSFIVAHLAKQFVRSVVKAQFE